MVGITEQQTMTDDVALRLVEQLTPEIEGAIADWHVIDRVLSDDWPSPSVQLLKFLVEPTRKRTPEIDLTEIDLTEADAGIDNDATVDADAEVIDLRVIDLTGLLDELETVDFYRLSA